MNIKDNTLVITSNYNKEYIMKNLNKLVNVKFMQLDEFLKHYCFDYDEDTIIYLMKKYNYRYENALTVIKNLYYIDNDKYDSDKLNELRDIKNDLISNNKLIFDNLFKYLIQDKNIIIYGYIIDEYLSKIINDNNITIINDELLNKSIDMYTFNNIRKEISFVCEDIISKIENNIDINKIKLVINDDYKPYIKYIFDIFNIPINLNMNNYMYSIPFIKTFMKYLKETKSIDKSLELINANYDINEDNINTIYNKLINIINNYVDVDINTLILCLEYKLKNTKINNKNKDNAINIIDLYTSFVENDEYVYILGFNTSNYPKLANMEDYLSDDLKNILKISTSYELNKIYKDYIINKINSINNLIITYSEKSDYDNYFVSFLNEYLNINIISNYKFKYAYSNLYNKLILSSYLDNNDDNDDFKILYNTIPDISYKKYDNKYKKINKNNFIKYLNNNLSLSYSSIDNYYKCGFRYYLNNVLKIKNNEETFDLFIGNLFHYILSIMNEKNFNFEDSFNEYLKKRDLTNMENVFIDKLKQELLFIINTIKDMNTYSKLNKYLTEEKITIKYNDDLKITFTGIIDKIMYQEEDGITYLAVIDYKTGNPDTSLDNIIYGINMQLPIYIYLVKNSNIFKNIKVLGFYYQKILNNEIINKNNKKLLKDMKYDNLKLIGYSNSDKELLERLDETYNDSKIIKSLKTSSEGFYAYSKVVSIEDIDKLNELVEKNIKNAISNILDVNFNINPKIINNINISCNYCEYKDICFKTYNDEVIINK